MTRASRLLERSKPQIPRGLKPARDGKNKGRGRGAKAPLYPSQAQASFFQWPARPCLPTFRAGRAAGLAGGEAGSMLIEFALSVWTLFLLTFLIFEFCMTIYTYSVLNNAAREGVRYAIAHGTDNASCSGPSTGCSDSTGVNVTNVVKGYAKVSFHDLTGMTVTPSWPDGTSTPSSRVIVTINYPYVPYLNVPGFNAPTMQATAEGRIVF
jgi:Flp pilus assembly protein TadG